MTTETLAVDLDKSIETRRQQFLAVDLDGFIYRCGFACEKAHYLVENSDGNFTRDLDGRRASSLASSTGGVVWNRRSCESVDRAISTLDIVLAKVINRYSGYEFKGYISGPSNFRDSVATVAKYKGNRDNSSRPVHYEALREHVLRSFNVFVTDGEEADDAVGVLCYNNKGSVCVSNDKDLDQIPGLHFNWTKDEEYRVTRKQADLNLYCQILSGDPTDNVPGVEGIGPVKARKMLADCASVRDCWETVRNTYIDKYGPDGEGRGLSREEAIRTAEGRAVEMARLVYIRRNEGELWEPPREPETASAVSA